MLFKLPEITLDASRGIPLYQQIADALRRAVIDGMLRPGDRLPPTRELARRLGVNTVTTARAYRELARRGWVSSTVGRGTFVCRQSRGKGCTSFAGEVGDLFPMEVLRGIINEVIDEDGAGAFAYDDAGGYEPLRASLSKLLVSSGFDLLDHELVVFSGAQQGLSILVKVLVRPGDWVLVERPTYPGILRLLAHTGARIEAVDLSGSGPDSRVLERLFRTRPFRLAYVMPTFQNPTGICYSDSQKRRLAVLCRTHGVALVEDDAFSDLDYGGGRRSPLRGVAEAFGECIYLKSFSHVMLPGFRLGFCLCSPRLAELLRRAKAEADLFSSGFFQRVLTHFINRGHFSEHLFRLQVSEQDRLRAVLSSRGVLAECGVTSLEPAGGVTLWCTLPAGIDPDRFHASCIQMQLPVVRGTEFSATAGLVRQFALSFRGLSGTRLHQTVRQVADLVSGQRRVS